VVARTPKFLRRFHAERRYERISIRMVGARLPNILHLEPPPISNLNKFRAGQIFGSPSR